MRWSDTLDGFLVSQHIFVLDLLSEFKCLDVSFGVSLLDMHVNLSTRVGDLLTDPSLYRRLVSKLNFLQHTQPDISFTVQHLSQFMSDPRLPHLEATYHVLRYLSGTSSLGLFLSNYSGFTLKGYCDSNWVSCADSSVMLQPRGA